MSWITAGTAAIRNSSTASTTTAPTVSTRPFTRFVTNVRSLTWSRATLIPVTSAAIPPDALQSAMRSATTTVIDRPGGVGLRDPGDLGPDERLDLVRERAGEVVHLVRHVVDVGDDSVGGDHDDQRGHEREERIERDSCRHEREAVLAEPARHLQADLLDTLHRAGAPSAADYGEIPGDRSPAAP